MTRETNLRTNTLYEEPRLNVRKGNRLAVVQPELAVSGLTLIECMVAIAVIGMTTAAIGPMLIFSVATRIQNQRADQALQLAQSEIDRVRLVVELGGDYQDDLAAIPLPSTETSIVRNVDAPTAFESSTSDIMDVTDARLVDIDGDGDDDYAIQLFRTEGISAGSTPVIFDVGARVYDARRARANLTGGLAIDTAGLTFTSGEGQTGTRPLAVIYSQISQGDRGASLCQQWELLSTTPGTAGATPSSMVCDD